MEITKRSLTPVEKTWVAHCIDQELRRRAETGSANELTIHQAKVRLNVALAKLQDTSQPDAVSFSEVEMAMVLPIFLIADSRKNPRSAQRIAHEMAHFLMREWVAPALYAADHVFCTDQDNPAAREEIAKDVDRHWGEEKVRDLGGSGGMDIALASMPEDVRRAFGAAQKMQRGYRSF